MKTLSINYDLIAPDRNYVALYNGIKSVSGYWARVTDSFWLVRTNKSPAQVRDELKVFLDNDDVLVVAEFGSWASYNLKKSTVDWLNRRVPA